MQHLLIVEDKIEYPSWMGKQFTYLEGLEIADKVENYLKTNTAILLTGPHELSKTAIELFGEAAGDWIYHLNDTTLIAEISPYTPLHGSERQMHIAFATAGKNAKKVLNDLQSILDKYL